MARYARRARRRYVEYRHSSSVIFTTHPCEHDANRSSEYMPHNASGRGWLYADVLPSQFQKIQVPASMVSTSSLYLFNALGARTRIMRDLWTRRVRMTCVCSQRRDLRCATLSFPVFSLFRM